MIKNVFIATPSYSGQFCAEYVRSLSETSIRLTNAGIGIYYAMAVGNPFLDIARNDLVDQFLASDADVLLFIDDDVGWDPKVVTRVLSYPQEVVGGLVPKRDAKSDSSFHDNAITGVVSKEGLFQAFEIPTAFLAIKRTAFEKLKKPYFKIGDNAKDFGEDIYFCRRWMETGEHMWIDHDITFTHTGKKAWKANFYDHCLTTGKITKEQAA